MSKDMLRSCNKAATSAGLENEQLRLEITKEKEGEGSDQQGTLRYDMIPDELMRGKILEIGARWGQHQLLSKHKERFLSNDYHGIDIEYAGGLLNIEKADVLEWETDEKFDTILILDVIEHIQYRDWLVLFEKMRQWLCDGGHLVVSCPYKERIANFHSRFLKDYWMAHVVFGIDKKLLHRWMPKARFAFTWRTRKFPKVEGERLIKSVFRELKRIVLRHKYAFLWVPRRRHVMTFWQKTDEQILEW